MDERIFMRADKKADYGTVARVMGQLSRRGLQALALVTEVEQGSRAVKVKVDKTLAASVALHVLVIGWGLVSFSSKAFEVAAGGIRCRSTSSPPTSSPRSPPA